MHKLTSLQTQCLALTLSAVLSASCGGNIFPYNPTPPQTSAETEQFATGSRILAGTETEVIVAAEARYRTKVYAASKSPEDSNLQKQYLETGMAVADVYCQAFLDELTKRQNRLNATRDYTNLAGGAAAAALGFAGGPASALALLGLGSSLVDNALSTTADNFLVAPDIPGVRKILGEAKEKLRARMLSPGPKSFAEAFSNLKLYDSQCGFLGIKTLVNESVAAGKVDFKNPAASASLNEAIATLQRQTLSKYLDVPSLDDKSIAALYAYFVTGDGKGGDVESKINGMFPKVDLKKLSNAAEVRLALEKLAGSSDLASQASNFVTSVKQSIAAGAASSVVQQSIQSASGFIESSPSKEVLEAATTAAAAAQVQPTPATVDNSTVIATTANATANANVALAGTLETTDDLSVPISSVLEQINGVKATILISANSTDAAAKISEAESLVGEAKLLAQADIDAAKQKIAAAATKVAEAIALAAKTPSKDPSAGISVEGDGTNSLILEVK